MVASVRTAYSESALVMCEMDCLGEQSSEERVQAGGFLCQLQKQMEREESIKMESSQKTKKKLREIEWNGAFVNVCVNGGERGRRRVKKKGGARQTPFIMHKPVIFFSLDQSHFSGNRARGTEGSRCLLGHF